MRNRIWAHQFGLAKAYRFSIDGFREPGDFGPQSPQLDGCSKGRKEPNSRGQGKAARDYAK